MITPWGLADDKTIVTDGIVFYSTPSHGGYKVSKAILAVMPKHLVNDDGWYEEDCEWSKVCIAFPHLFPPEALEHAKRSYQWLINYQKGELK